MSSLLSVLAVPFASAIQCEVERMERGQKKVQEIGCGALTHRGDGAPLATNKREELGPLCMTTLHVAAILAAFRSASPHIHQIQLALGYGAVD